MGKVTPITVYVASQVNARAVPLSNNLNINLPPSTGVPVGALIVSPAANAVYAYISLTEIFGVKDDADAAEVTLGAGVTKDKTPEPLVCITCAFVPSADGKVKVTVPEVGAFNVITPASA